MLRISSLWLLTVLLATCSLVYFQSESQAQAKPRVRALGVVFDATHGPHDAITDVQDVELGHTPRSTGEGKLVAAKGPLITGITTILPQGKNLRDRVFAARSSRNGNGEMTGTT